MEQSKGSVQGQGRWSTSKVNEVNANWPEAFLVDNSSLCESLDWRQLGSAPRCHHWHPTWLGGLEASCWDFSSPMNLCLSGLPKVRGKVRSEKGIGPVPPHQPWRKSSPEGSSEDTEAHRPEPNMLLHMPSPGHLRVIYLTRLQQSKNPRAEGWSPPALAVTQPGCFSTLLMGFGTVGTCSPTFTLVPGGGEQLPSMPMAAR